MQQAQMTQPFRNSPILWVHQVPVRAINIAALAIQASVVLDGGSKMHI